MIRGLTILLVFQSLGEIASRLITGIVPGPVVGMVLLVIYLVSRKQISTSIALAADGLLAHLAIFFVPAAVGVMLYLGTLKDAGVGVFIAIVLSTISAIAVTALTIKALSRVVHPAPPEIEAVSLPRGDQ